MTMLCDEALVTPSERMLRVGPDPSQVAAYAEAAAALQAFRGANLSVGGLAVLGAEMRPSASTQFVGADDPRHVLFNGTVIVSASALAGAALLANIGSGIAVVPHGGIGSHMAEHGFSVWYGSPLESEHEVAVLSTSASAVVGVDDELLNWETPKAVARPAGGRVLFHVREGSRRPFRLVSDD